MSAHQKVVLLVDYKGEYFPRQKRTPRTTDLELLIRRLAQLEVELSVMPFADVNLSDRSWVGLPVIYQSSQDPNLHYKGYLEDLLFGLDLSGARLIPQLPFFRAHHNKVMMELLREICAIEKVRSLRAQAFGTYEDFSSRADELDYPVVLKRSDGDSARGVVLAHDAEQARRLARRLMQSVDFGDLLDNVQRSLKRIPIRAHSLHRRKMIVQPYLEGLDHDYKAVWMGERVFVETRATRKNDFRASGSGMRSFPEKVPSELLDLVERIGQSSGSAHASIDLMVHRGEIHVGEMQFIRFGTNPVVLAPHAWVHEPSGWVRVEGPFCWEEELAHSIASRLNRVDHGQWRSERSEPTSEFSGQKEAFHRTLADTP